MACVNLDRPLSKKPTMRCDYRRDHGHETNRCQSLKFQVERLIKAGHLRRYIKEVDRKEGSTPTASKTTTGTVASPEPRPAIKYILGGPFENQYQSKRQQKKLLRATTIKARVKAIHISGSRKEIEPIDEPYILSPYQPEQGHYAPL